MPSKIEKLAVLFADICGSTALYERLGDTLARQLIAKCIKLMTSKVTAHQGTLIKTIGDEIMCTFPSTEAAMHAACAMQHALENERSDDMHRMHIRIGFHYGDVICESNDVYGDTVNVAARVASVTRANQIMATLAAINMLPPDLREKTRPIFRAEFKGKQEQFEIFQITWEDDDMLRTRIGTPKFRTPQEHTLELGLRYRDQSFKINEQNKSLLIGREEVCDICVQNTFASRQHARIELRFGKFIITDQSTNGTFIRFSDGSVIRLTREDTLLRGSGSISLGQPYSDNPGDLIEFSSQSISA
jgi:adenylate cyclase